MKPIKMIAPLFAILYLSGCTKNLNPVQPNRASTLPPFSFNTISDKEPFDSREDLSSSAWAYFIDEPIDDVYKRLKTEIPLSLKVTHHRQLENTASWTIQANDKTYFIVLLPGKPGAGNNFADKKRSHCIIQIF